MSESDDTTWPTFVAEVAAEALHLATNHPRAALSQARVAAEAICTDIHRREIGEPGKLMLDELARKLASKKLLPPQRELALRTVQTWGNFGAHPIDFAKIDADFILPCVVALQQIVVWYFAEYLRMPAPPALATHAAIASPPVRMAIAIVSGAAAGRRFPLVRGSTVRIGRDPSADIQLDESDLKVHREHAQIDVPAIGAPLLRELGGRNPTRVNDLRITAPTTLSHGDHVQVGRTILRVELGED